MQTVTQNLRQPPSPERAEPAGPLVSHRARNTVAAVLAAAFSLALAYWVGRAEGTAKTEAIEYRAQQQKVGHEKDTDQLRERLTRLETRNQLLEARRLMHRSLIALQQDNFGTAREHLAKAHELVQAQKPIPGSALSDLNDALAGIELGVTADPMPQRLELTRLANNFDALLDS